MSNVQTDRIQEDGHLHQVQVGDAEHDGDSLQYKTGAELGHTHIGDSVGMDIGLALQEGGGSGAELGHNHEVGTVNVNLGLAIPGAGREEVRQRVDGQDDGAVRREVRRLDGVGGSNSLNIFWNNKNSKICQA